MCLGRGDGNPKSFYVLFCHIPHIKIGFLLHKQLSSWMSFPHEHKFLDTADG